MFSWIFVGLLLMPSSAKPAKHDPDAYSCSGHGFGLADFQKTPSVESPNHHNVIRMTHDFAFEVYADGKHIGDLPNDLDISANLELGWSPDSRFLFITYSDGGSYGNYHVRVWKIADLKLDPVDVVSTAFNDFAQKHYCEARGNNNVFLLEWTANSSAVFLVTQVLPTGDCAEGGRSGGYLVDANTGAIIRRFSQRQVERIKRSCWRHGALSVGITK